MNELIETITRDDGTIAVSGRELHDFLEVDTRFNDWFQRMAEYGFTEGQDFYSFLSKTPSGGRPSTDYVMTLDMAKEVAMIQRTDKGKQARQYFIAVEKRYKQLAALPRTPEEKLALTMEVATRAVKRIEKLDGRVTDLEENVLLAPGEYNYISKQVNRAVANYLDVHHCKLSAKQRSLFYRDINHGLNDYIGVKTRTQLRKKDFDKADDFIQNWTPSTVTIMKAREISLFEGQQQEVI